MPISPRTPPRRARIAAALLAPTIVACGAGGNDDLASAPAQELAAGAEQLATLLDTAAACDAIAQAAALRDRAREGRDAGEVPDDVVLRIERVTDEVTRDLSCTPEPASEPEPEPATESEPQAEPEVADSPDDPPPADDPPSRDEGNGNEDEDDKGKDNQGKGNEGKGNDGKGNDGKGNQGKGNDGKGNG